MEEPDQPINLPQKRGRPALYATPSEKNVDVEKEYVVKLVDIINRDCIPKDRFRKSLKAIVKAIFESNTGKIDQRNLISDYSNIDITTGSEDLVPRFVGRKFFDNIVLTRFVTPNEMQSGTRVPLVSESLLTLIQAQVVQEFIVQGLQLQY